MANPYGSISWEVENIVTNGDSPEEVAIQLVVPPSPSPSPHFFSWTSQNKASSCVRSILPGRGGSAASTLPPRGLTSRQTEKERARNGDSAGPMALHGAAPKVVRAVSRNEAKKLHLQVAGITRRVLNAECTNSCPRLASRNKVGAKRHE